MSYGVYYSNPSYTGGFDSPLYDDLNNNDLNGAGWKTLNNFLSSNWQQNQNQKPSWGAQNPFSNWSASNIPSNYQADVNALQNLYTAENNASNYYNTPANYAAEAGMSPVQIDQYMESLPDFSQLSQGIQNADNTLTSLGQQNYKTGNAENQSLGQFLTSQEANPTGFLDNPAAGQGLGIGDVLGIDALGLLGVGALGGGLGAIGAGASAGGGIGSTITSIPSILSNSLGGGFLGSLGSGATIGAGGGALLGKLEGGNVLQGAIEGSLLGGLSGGIAGSGGLTGIGNSLGNLVGDSTFGSDIGNYISGLGNAVSSDAGNTLYGLGNNFNSLVGNSATGTGTGLTTDFSSGLTYAPSTEASGAAGTVAAGYTPAAASAGLGGGTSGGFFDIGSQAGGNTAGGFFNPSDTGSGISNQFSIPGISGAVNNSAASGVSGGSGNILDTSALNNYGSSSGVGNVGLFSNISSPTAGSGNNNLINGLLRTGLSGLFNQNPYQGYGQVANTLNTQASAYNPYVQGGTQAQNTLNSLYGLNGNGAQAAAQANWQNTPGYQFQLQQGISALQNSAAANGGLLSGNTGEALQQYGQGLANTTYNQYLSNLQNQVGQGQNALGAQSNLYGQAAIANQAPNMYKANNNNNIIGNLGSYLFPTNSNNGGLLSYL